MFDILIKAGCYIAIIILGMVLRAVGFFKEEDFSVLSRIVIKITLPATIISGAAGLGVKVSLCAQCCRYAYRQRYQGTPAV